MVLNFFLLFFFFFEQKSEGAILHTWWRVWIIFRECHHALEIAPVVKRVWVQDHEGDVPTKDIFFKELPV